MARSFLHQWGLNEGRYPITGLAFAPPTRAELDREEYEDRHVRRPGVECPAPASDFEPLPNWRTTAVNDED